MIFQDRTEAGKRLAERLEVYRNENPLVMALPRGGVVVGYEVARALEAPLDLIVARKIGAPFQPELGIGAIAPGGVVILDERTLRTLNIDRARIEQLVEMETGEMERRLSHYRGSRPLPDLQDRTVILVDDGLATGVTARAAIECLRRQRVKRLVLAVPVCAGASIDLFRSWVDDLVCLHAPDDFRAVGLWYHNFDQTSDETVLRLLEAAQVWEPVTTASEH